MRAVRLLSVITRGASRFVSVQSRLCLLLAMAGCLASCGGTASNNADARKSGGSVTSESAVPTKARGPSSTGGEPGASTAEADLSTLYTATVTDLKPGIKRSVEVLLNEKVTETTLRQIATDIRASDSSKYKRTFIGYRLREAPAEIAYWATTHFDPYLEVKIMGLTLEKEAALKAASPVPGREMIGKWIDETPGGGGLVSIYVEGGAIYLENSFSDGSNRKMEVVERQTNSGRRFDKKDGSSTGDHYIVRADGQLEVRDNQGLICRHRSAH